MKQHYARNLSEQIPSGAIIEFLGWLKARRGHSRVTFLDICDLTGSIQAVFDRDLVGPEVFEAVKRVPLEFGVAVRGSLYAADNGEPAKEIRATAIEVIGAASLSISPLPRSDIDIFDQSLQPQLLDKRHFYLRNEKTMAILRFRHLLMRIVHQWFHDQGFIEIHAPVLTPTPLYDDRTPIALEVQGQHVYLTQCVGFYLEHSVHAFEKIYNIGPSFRAEESRSKRHLMEYWHIKAELAFVEFEDLAATVEKFIHDVTKQSLAEGQHLAQVLGTKICPDGLKIPFPRIDYCEAVAWLSARGCDIEFGKGLGSEEEALLSERFGDTPFWVVGIPRSIEPFPYVIDPKDRARTMTADLIASRGYGELLGIAEKIHTLAMLDERLAEKGKATDPRYEWLRDLRQFGCVPHGGFGMGVERLIRWLLDIPHVRDTIPFHRAFGRRIHP